MWKACSAFIIPISCNAVNHGPGLTRRRCDLERSSTGRWKTCRSMSQLDCDTFPGWSFCYKPVLYCVVEILYIFIQINVHFDSFFNRQASTPSPLTPWRARASWRCAAPSAATWSAWRWRAGARPWTPSTTSTRSASDTRVRKIEIRQKLCYLGCSFPRFWMLKKWYFFLLQKSFFLPSTSKVIGRKKVQLLMFRQLFLINFLSN